MDALFLAKCLVCLYFAVLFLQSGIDKFVDWNGNVHYLDHHFGGSALHPFVLPMLAVITFMELATGVLCLGSVFSIAAGGADSIPILAMTLACLTLTMLFAGQRIVKDYPGAATITAYFGVALVGLLLQWPLLPNLPSWLKPLAQ